MLGGVTNLSVYLGVSSEMNDMKIVNYDGNPQTNILFENETDFIKYNAGQKELDILMNMIKVNNGIDYAVKHTALNTALQTFITALNLALASKLDGSGAPGVLTLNISTAKVDKVML